MKTMKKVLLGAALAAGGVLMASPNKDLPAKEKMSTEITDLLENPSFNVEEEVLADVIFTVNDQNEIVVLSVHTDNPIVEDFIKNRLNYKKISVHAELSEYKVTVRVIS